MIALIQRVTRASVTVNSMTIAEISAGLVVLLGIEKHDSEASARMLAKKICSMRIFNDTNHKMNLSLLDSNGELLVVSQFTLAADTSSGNRPSFSNAAPPSQALALYEYFVAHVTEHYLPCRTGEFAADMQVHLTNDGPVTFHLKV